MRFPTKIPVLVGLLLLVGIVGGVVGITEFVTRSRTQASPSTQPANVVFANVTDQGFTVTWTTPDPTTGAVSLSVKGKRTTAYDERDAAGKLGKYLTHSVPVQGLSQNTQVEVTILSDGKKVKTEKPYRINTAPSLVPGTTGLDPAYGTVKQETEQPAAGALVYLTVEGGQTLSTMVKPSGSWIIPLNLLRSEDLTDYLPVTERMEETILVRGDNMEANALSDTLNDSPMPEIVLGKTYDFRKQQAKAVSAPVALRDSSPSPQSPAVLGQSTPSMTVSLISPAANAAMPTVLPLIQGTGIPGKTVTLTVGITNPASGSVTVGADGLWRFTPPYPLAPGKQAVTITTVDRSNQPVAITHMFEVLKSGTQVLGDATPSATLEPTPTEKPASTVGGEPVPTSGDALPTIILIVMATGLVMSGAAIAFATRIRY